jgi:hypothetical protein
MALQGNFTYKGIDISSAYLVVSNLNYNKYSKFFQNEVTPPVYNSETGELTTPATYETAWNDVLAVNTKVKIYKDSSARISNPNEFVTSLSFDFIPSIADNADNLVVQAYNYIKSLDDYSGYTDV